MKAVLTILLLSNCIICNARQPIKRLSSDSLPNTFVIRGKVLPWALLLVPGSGFGASLGGEYQFCKVHAIGFDAAYTEFKIHPGEHYDSSAKKYVPTPESITTVTRSILLSYRYYPPYLVTTRDVSYRPYFSIFTRFCNMDDHPDDGYIGWNFIDGNRVKYDEQQFSIGLLYGIIAPYRIGHLNIDMNMGPFWKWKTIQDIRIENGTNVTRHISTQNFGWRVGFNVALVYRR